MDAGFSWCLNVLNAEKWNASSNPHQNQVWNLAIELDTTNIQPKTTFTTNNNLFSKWRYGTNITDLNIKGVLLSEKFYSNVYHKSALHHYLKRRTI